MEKPQAKHLTFRIIVVVSIMLGIAAIHAFRLGSHLSGQYYILYYSYASDIMLPFGCYFLLSLNEIQLKFLRPWLTKSAVVFGAMTLSEVVQYFDIYFFGTTYDPIDILMYALGTFLAVIVDTVIFKRFLPLWSYTNS